MIYGQHYRKAQRPRIPYKDCSRGHAGEPDVNPKHDPTIHNIETIPHFCLDWEPTRGAPVVPNMPLVGP